MNFNDMFDRAIPGQSLTQAPGGMPYEQPPQYPSDEEAMYYMLDRLSSKDVAPAVATALENGIHASDITNSLLMKGFATGKFTADVGGLIAKRTMASVVATGVAQGVNPKDIKFKKPDKRKQQALMNIMATAKGKKPEQQAPQEAPVAIKGVMGNE